MASVTVREFRVVPTLPGARVKAKDVKAIPPRRLELNMAEVLRTNALAVRYHGRLVMPLVQREMALVLSLFGHTPPGQPLRRHHAFDGSSLHIRRFACEAAALGMLTAVVRDCEPTLADVAHFDALSDQLQALYPVGRVRPDLRFAGANVVLAGESRGRSQSRVQRPPAVAQLKRLDQLLAWSRRPACDEVCMAWSWIEQDRSTIDFFRFEADAHRALAEALALEPSPAVDPDPEGPTGTPPLWGDDEVPAPEAQPPDDSETEGPTEAAPPWGADVERPDPSAVRRDVEPPPDRIDVVGVQSTTSPTSAGPTPAARREHVRRTVADREEQLLASAPDVSVPGLPGHWRGRWQDVWSLGDRATGRVLLAATVQGPVERVDSVRADWIEESLSTRLELAAVGRVLVAIDWEQRPVEETGEVLARWLGGGS